MTLKIDKNPSDAAKLAAAKATITELNRYQGNDFNDHDDANALAKCGDMHKNGYELAKELESRHFWDIDAEIVDILDGHSRTLEQHRNKDVQAWADENNIEPPIPLFTRVKRVGFGRSITGTIKGIYDSRPCSYKVKEDGCENETRYVILWWDEVEALADQKSEVAA